MNSVPTLSYTRAWFYGCRRERSSAANGCYTRASDMWRELAKKAVIGGFASLAAIACDPPLPAPPPAPAAVPIVDTRAAAPLDPPGREALERWTTLPTSAAELEQFLADVCAATAAGDGDANALRFAEDHLPLGNRPVAGHYPSGDTASFSAPTEVSMVMLHGDITRRRLEACDKPRTVKAPTVSGEKAWTTIDVAGLPFEVMVEMAGGTARLVRFSLVVEPIAERPKLSRPPAHVPLIATDDLTDTDEGQNAAKLVEVMAASTLCIDQHIVDEEERDEPRLASYSVTVAVGDGSLGPKVSVFAAAQGVDLTLLGCLTGGLRNLLASLPRYMAIPETHPELADQPITRIRVLIPLKANEVPKGDVIELDSGCP